MLEIVKKARGEGCLHTFDDNGRATRYADWTAASWPKPNQTDELKTAAKSNLEAPSTTTAESSVPSSKQATSRASISGVIARGRLKNGASGSTAKRRRKDEHWEDEEFEPATLSGVSPAPPTAWDDEEEEEEEVVRGPQKPTLSEATKKRHEEKAAALKSARLNEVLDNEESTEEKKLRERRLVEEGDNALTNELFGAVQLEEKLKDLKDHLQLALSISDRMSESKRNHVLAFLKEFLRSVEDKLEPPDIAEIVARSVITASRGARRTATRRAAVQLLNAQKEAKVKAVKKPTQAKSKKKSKKELLDMQKKADDNFGAATGGDEYDHYEDQFDDFF
ncbi:hypothetical protein CTAYLR_004563 [Chrysophaeum taylorii]|uniref:Uncharacterized protein n=1 Tax=Chrysophaeum taylorii TaxID=2483200 RepID=A0AAD7UG20_9STRA|nr:hypothetical protein CTAYLR_004563 [Chrysophaeum taylorii]